MIDFASTSAAILKYFPPICTVQYSSPFTCPQGCASRMMVNTVPLLNFSVLSRRFSSAPTCSPMMLSRVSSKISLTSVQAVREVGEAHFYNSSIGHSFGNRSADPSGHEVCSIFLTSRLLPALTTSGPRAQVAEPGAARQQTGP
jgi:hypothetical protein